MPGAVTSGQAAGVGAAAGVAGGLAAGLPSKGTTITSGTGTNSSQGVSNTASNTSSQSQTSSNTLSDYLAKLLSSYSGSTTSTPNLTPQMQAYINSLMGRFGAQTTPSLSGYQANQIQGINANSDVQRQAVNNIMASRGLANSPVAGTAEANIEGNRINQITQMSEQLPLLKNQLDLQNLNAASSFSGMLPGLTGYSTTQAGQQTSDQTGTQSSSTDTANYQQMWQNLFNWFDQHGNQANYNKQDTSQGGGVGQGIAGAISAALPFILMAMSDKRLKKDISPIDKAIDKIRALKPVTWKWKGGEVGDAGLIAQDVENVLPNVVHEDSSMGTPLKKINYAAIFPYLIKSMQELDSKVEALG